MLAGDSVPCEQFLDIISVHALGNPIAFVYRGVAAHAASVLMLINSARSYLIEYREHHIGCHQLEYYVTQEKALH